VGGHRPPLQLNLLKYANPTFQRLLMQSQEFEPLTGRSLDSLQLLDPERPLDIDSGHSQQI